MSSQRAIQNLEHDTDITGYWSVTVRAPIKGVPTDITRFRGVPVQLSNYSFTDPFGPGQLSFTVPTVSPFERRGYGDLSWAVKHADIDLVWRGPLPPNYPFGTHNRDGSVTPSFRWEGYLTTFGISKTGGLQVQAKGAMLQLDNYLAKPEYTSRPLPYEWAIARQFVAKPALRLSPLKVYFPSWWAKTYVPVPKAPSWMIPSGVSKGQRWTALLTRETGSFDAALTSYIQSLLGAMYTERGRFTLMLDTFRQPVLLHTDMIASPDARTIEINPAAPGVDFELSEDWDQSLTDVYVQGVSLAGVSYSGMQSSADGSVTFYQPAAALRQTYPPNNANGWFHRDVVPKEVRLQMQQGLNADDAELVARNHLARFSEPGMTGTVTLTTDPMLGQNPLSRFLVRAGMPVHLPGVNGSGILAHVTGSECNFEEGSVTLNIDTKFRDALTVEEVRTRGRDALSVTRMLVAGQYQPPIPDQMWPWSYAEGSGYIPSNSLHSSLPLFNGMPQMTPFPWTDWTKQRPPKDRRWASSYIRLGPASSNANNNWATQHTATGNAYGIPIHMGQSGQIRLLQMAAFDRDGKLLRVPFHVGFYAVDSVNVLTMPPIPVEQAKFFPPYKPGQRYPFVKDAFERTLRDGTAQGKNDPNSYESVGPIRIYGTYDEKAGYWPGSMSAGDAPTGLLVDETQWSWDLTAHGDALWDPYSIERNHTSPKRGFIFMMIYCDAQQDQEVFFAGRMFRVEPGVGGNGA